LEAQVFDESLSFDPEGNYLLFSKADIFKNFYTYKDLYLLNLKNKMAYRLTEGLRASDPDFSPDGKRIVFVKNEKGSRSLWLAEIKEPENKFSVPSRFAMNLFAGFQLTSVESGTQYFSPTFSPDGKKIAVAKYERGGRQKIYLVDVKSGKEEILNKHDLTSTEANPCFTPDGRYLLFDSDRTGIVNLYAYELTAGKRYQITNVLGIAAMPEVSPDGKHIAYLSYSSQGYDVAVMDFNPSQWKEVRSSDSLPATNPVSSIGVGMKNETDQQNRDFTDADKRDYEIHDYHPWPALLPRFWIPYDYYNENGPQTSIYIGGLDPLRHHFYYLNFGYDFESNKPSYTFYYANNQFLPQITFSLSDWSVPYGIGNSSFYWERQREAALLFSFYQNRVLREYDRQAFTVGLQMGNLTNISSLETLSPKPSLGNLNALVLAWRYLSSRRYAYSISPEDGIDLTVKAEIYSRVLSSDFSFTNYSASLVNYLRSIFKHQVLASSLNGFYSKGDQLTQANFSWRALTLRGYPSTFLKGNKGLSLSLEYRYPIFYPEWGLLYGATFFDRVWGDLFFDIGSAGFGPMDQFVYKRGMGTELNLDLVGLWGWWAMTLKLGYAVGLDEGGQQQFYLTVGL
ncbi:MAG: hypothetical protein ACPL4K_02085, partial [Candidatus Margulisiibacteriota bacterium]